MVTCTQAKRVAPEVTANTGAIDLQIPVHARVARWARALQDSQAPTRRARDLYSGDHWSVSAGLHAPSGPRPISVWVASAGYGLVGIDAPLIPYAATFRAGETDSVCAATGESEAWWDGLSAEVPSPVAGAPRSLEDVVAADPDAGLLIVASPSYLTAMARDAGQAQAGMNSPERAIVVAAGADRRSFPLSALAVHFDARIREVVGGGMQGLNARVARLILEKSAPDELSRSRAQAVIDEASACLPKFEYPRREGQGDEQVVAFIRESIQAKSKCTKTGLLREWRAQGLACEQNRFGALFESVQAEFHVEN